MYKVHREKKKKKHAKGGNEKPKMTVQWMLIMTTMKKMWRAIVPNQNEIKTCAQKDCTDLYIELCSLPLATAHYSNKNYTMTLVSESFGWSVPDWCCISLVILKLGVMLLINFLAGAFWSPWALEGISNR